LERCAAGAVPNIIWSYWDDLGAQPVTVKLARASWGVFAPQHRIYFLDQYTWREHADVRTTESHCKTHTAFADWLRLRLLATHGGIWLDAAVLLTAPIESLVNASAEVSGVDIHDGGGMNFEVSFIAAIPNSSILNRWLQKYQQVCDMDDKDYDAWLVELKSVGIEALNGQYAECDWKYKSRAHAFLEWWVHAGSTVANLFIRYTQSYVHPCGQHFWMHYLKANTALNAVLQISGHDPRPLWQEHGLSTRATEESLMLVPHMNGYDDEKTAAFLIGNASHGLDLFAMGGIKLTSGDRASLERHSTCVEGSIICYVQQVTHTAYFVEAPANPRSQHLEL
jgi:hypothetical protein